MKKAKLVLLNKYRSSETGNMVYVYAVTGKNKAFIQEYLEAKIAEGYGNLVEADDENPEAIQNKYVGQPVLFSTERLMQGSTLIKTRNGKWVAEKPEQQELMEGALDRYVAKMFKQSQASSAADNDDDEEDEDDEVPQPEALKDQDVDA